MYISLNNKFYNIYTKNISFKGNEQSKKTLLEEKYAETPKVSMDAFASDRINLTYKKMLWELSEIPYFNAVAKNLSSEESSISDNLFAVFTPLG